MIRVVEHELNPVPEDINSPVVASPRQVGALLAAVDHLAPELAAFFGCLYYACMRPGEAVILRQADCTSPPASAWGLLLLSGNAPLVGSQWTRTGTQRQGVTDSGTSHDRPDLKHRARKATRPVPIPPSWSTCCGAISSGSGETRMGGCSAVRAAPC